MNAADALIATGRSLVLNTMIEYVLLVSRQGRTVQHVRATSAPNTFHPGKVRLAKWFTTLPPKSKSKIVKDVTQLVLARRTKMCNFLEYKDTKVVYRRYASLFFVCGIGSTDNELVTLEIIHRFVEVLDRYFGNVRISFESFRHVSQVYRSVNWTCKFYYHPGVQLTQFIRIIGFSTFRRHTR